MPTVRMPASRVSCQISYICYVRADELQLMLEQLRKARAGTLDATNAPEPLASYIGYGLGYLCDRYAEWIESDRQDRRAVDAALRFYGLSRMPEPLATIAPTLRTWGEKRGVTKRRVQQLIGELLDRLADSAPRLEVKRSTSSLSDPFVPPLSHKDRRRLTRVLLWAWADAIDLPSLDGVALLLYQYEHGLRPTGPVPPTREDKRRLRRRAWSMLTVANFRLEEAEPTRTLVERSLGPRHLALLDDLQSEGLEALMLLDASDVGLRQALDCVRAAVRAGRPEAPELLGLLRDATSRMNRAPPEVTSKILALTAILGRERRDPAGTIAGVEAIRHAANVLTGYTRADAECRLPVLSDGLRAGHEAAQLAFAVGDLRQGWQLLRSTRSLLDAYGDPERETEPEGWNQQLLMYEASWLRKFSHSTHDPERWLRRADVLAARSAELTLGAGLLPVEWGLNAESQRVGVLLDEAEQVSHAGDTGETSRLIRVGRHAIEELEANWRSLGDERAGGALGGHIRSGLQSLSRNSWRAALIEGDKDAAESARQEAWRLASLGASPMARDKLLALDAASAAVGLEPIGDVGGPEVLGLLQDRARLHTSMALRGRRAA